ncbi:MAG: ATP-binding cassette domain-containing protein [Senegalimassilia faecalis]
MCSSSSNADEEPKSEALVAASQVDGSVEFDHVRFGYAADEPIIKDFSAQVSEGQTIALVGPTGAGKTTMVKLLMRFYDVDSGAIRIGGMMCANSIATTCASLFGMVLQDTWLFNGSVRDNIRLWTLGCNR